MVRMNTIGKKLPFQRFLHDSEDSYEETSTTSDGTQGEGELNNPTLEQIKKQMGLFSSNVDKRKKLQIETVGKMLKEWKLLPEDHQIDEEILYGILDKDHDDKFSF